VSRPGPRRSTALRRTHTGPTSPETHRAHLAAVDLRQSTPGHLVHHRASPTRPYALVERAVALGWPAARGHVIDADRATSGASAAQRVGFPPRCAARRLGRVGRVRRLEAARVARHRADGARLRALGALVGAIMADAECGEDPRQEHDRVRLGLAGSRRAAALPHLPRRRHAAPRPQAARGAFALPRPAGRARLRRGEGVRHPDEEVHARLRRVCDPVDRLGRARAVAPSLHRHPLPVPTRPHQGPPPWPIVWVGAQTHGGRTLLPPPASTGAAVWGTSTTAPARRTPGVAPSGVGRGPQAPWQVCRPHPSPASLTWEPCMPPPPRLRAHQSRSQDGHPGAARMGPARRHGRARGGRGGTRLWRRSRRAHGQRPGEVCHAHAIA